jgi:hypothetical protein
MTIILRFAILAALTSASCIAADSPESRFDPSKARKLTPEQAKLFGPGAEKHRYDPVMIRAAEIAARRARKQ